MRPNDRLYNRQWALRRIRVERAWDRVRNIRRRVIIAIIDTGVDINHPDLAGKTLPGRNYIDGPNMQDPVGHGTFIAGAAAAATNNRRGIAGVSFNTALILPVRITDDNENIQNNAILARAIDFARRQGARVINISGTTAQAVFDLGVQQAIDRAWNENIVIIAMAGNKGNQQIQYPAGYNHVLAVSGVNRNGGKLDISNFGVDIGIASPGENILSTTPVDPPAQGWQVGYDVGSGTSVAAGMVSGLAAMLIAANPRLTNEQIIRIIQRTAQSVDAGGRRSRRTTAGRGWNPIFGYGLINAEKAMRAAVSPGRHTRGRTGQRGSFYGRVVNPGPAGSIVQARQNGRIISEYTTLADGIFRLSNLAPGIYTILIDGFRQGSFRIRRGSDTFLQL